MISESEHILLLASQLIDDIELSRLSAESLLLKASRLARFVGDEETNRWNLTLVFLLPDLPPFTLQGESSPVIRHLPSSGSPHSDLSRLQCCCRPLSANQHA